MAQSKYASLSGDYDDTDERGGDDGVSAAKGLFNSPELQNVIDLVDMSVWKKWLADISVCKNWLADILSVQKKL